MTKKITMSISTRPSANSSRAAARQAATKASPSGTAPEKRELTIGIIPLTDCASVVMAAELGLFEKHGLNVTVSKEASWAAVRDKLSLGLLDAAHALYGLVYGVHLGIGGPKKDMAVLMGLNRNGQAINLSNQLAQAGVTDGPSLKKLVAAGAREYTFAQTFPTGTHAMWLYYWLAAAGIDPLNEVRSITVPPPQMVPKMRAGDVDGFCVGEPWAARAITERVGFTVATSQAIWRNHPEKVLGCTREFAERYPNTARAMIRAVLEASRYVDSAANRDEVAAVIGHERYVAAPAELIAGRLRGEYDDGRGTRWTDPDHMKFFDGGAVNFPYLSDGMWFLTQFKRWGLVQGPIDYAGIARQVNRIELYTEVARSMDLPLPDSPLRTDEFFDGAVWDPARPEEYVKGFKIKAAGI